jgi:hypothetical protein
MPSKWKSSRPPCGRHRKTLNVNVQIEEQRRHAAQHWEMRLLQRWANPFRTCRELCVSVVGLVAESLDTVQAAVTALQ